MHSDAIPAVPASLGFFLRLPPLFPLRILLQRMTDNISLRRPDLCLRLEGHADKIFLIDPIDLPFVFSLKLHPDRLSVEPLYRKDVGRWNARIAGLFAALIGLIQGAYDGDALFFSRDLVIEGDTEAVLALRNVLDDAELDLAAAAAAAFGPAAPAVERIAAHILPAVSRLTGFTFLRADGH